MAVAKPILGETWREAGKMLISDAKRFCANRLAEVEIEEPAGLAVALLSPETFPQLLSRSGE